MEPGTALFHFSIGLHSLARPQAPVLLSLEEAQTAGFISIICLFIPCHKKKKIKNTANWYTANATVLWSQLRPTSEFHCIVHWAFPTVSHTIVDPLYY